MVEEVVLNLQMERMRRLVANIEYTQAIRIMVNVLLPKRLCTCKRCVIQMFIEQNKNCVS